MSKALNLLGIVYLIGAIILAIMIFANYGSVEIGGYYSRHTELNPMAVGMAVGVAFQGALVFCLALGLAKVIDKCEEITYKLDTVGKNTEKKKYLKCKNCGALNEDNGYTRRCKECDGLLTNSDVVEM